MNVVWIVADTFRRDHIGAYGNNTIHTPALDAMAANAVRFDRHYAASFPTMPARADHATGLWTMSFMGWEKLPVNVTTLAEILNEAGFHTAASVDTPFYLTDGMNYDRGFRSFLWNDAWSRLGAMSAGGHDGAGTFHSSRDWRYEADLMAVDIGTTENHRSFQAPRTFANAIEWLSVHADEDFFLYIDTWDPHEPWDAPRHYTDLYWPNYTGELIHPLYGNWHDVPGYTHEKVAMGHATYCGEVTMVDTWIGFLLNMIDHKGITDNTAVIFTSDHGFYFGEHGGLFGKMNSNRRADGTLRPYDSPEAKWAHSPLYEEVVGIPLLVQVPGVASGSYQGLTSAVDVMPTVIQLAGLEIPPKVDGHSLVPALQDKTTSGRSFVISGLSFADIGDSVRSVDSFPRVLEDPPVTTVTTDAWSLLYSSMCGASELFNLESDPTQQLNVIRTHQSRARELHQCLLKFMDDTGVARDAITVRQNLCI